jgi:hypothetical protein
MYRALRRVAAETAREVAPRLIRAAELPRLTAMILASIRLTV